MLYHLPTDQSTKFMDNLLNKILNEKVKMFQKKKN